MKERALVDKKIEPTNESLEEVLEGTVGFYKDMMLRVSKYDSKWTFYKGWSLKVFDKKKALFYLLPFVNSFQIGMTIREAEKTSIMEDSKCKEYYDQVSQGEKYPEGIGLKFNVVDKESYENCIRFIEIIMRYR